MRDWPVWLRFAVHATFSLLWLVGTAVFVMKHFFQAKDVFGPHPWQPPLTELHGVLAVLATFLFGWLAADLRAQRPKQNISGTILIALLTWLVVTGFAQFFLVSDEWRGVDATLHEYSGLAFLLPWLAYLTWEARPRP